MAYHIRKSSVIDSAKTVYYTKTAANKLINGAKGGFTGATAVSN